MTEQLERLAAAGIQLLPADLEKFFLFERDGFVALVERTGTGFGQIGASGLLTENGYAPLMWRGDAAYFVTKELEQPATADQVMEMRRFSADLKAALK